jgi:hypothetical protein
MQIILSLRAIYLTTASAHVEGIQHMQAASTCRHQASGTCRHPAHAVHGTCSTSLCIDSTGGTVTLLRSLAWHEHISMRVSRDRELDTLLMLQSSLTKPSSVEDVNLRRSHQVSSQHGTTRSGARLGHTSDWPSTRPHIIAVGSLKLFPPSTCAFHAGISRSQRMRKPNNANMKGACFRVNCLSSSTPPGRPEHLKTHGMNSKVASAASQAPWTWSEAYGVLVASQSEFPCACR